jgi:hypothetical protein
MSSLLRSRLLTPTRAARVGLGRGLEFGEQAPDGAAMVGVDDGPVPVRRCVAIACSAAAICSTTLSGQLGLLLRRELRGRRADLQPARHRQVAQVDQVQQDGRLAPRLRARVVGEDEVARGLQALGEGGPRRGCPTARPCPADGRSAARWPPAARPGLARPTRARRAPGRLQQPRRRDRPDPVAAEPARPQAKRSHVSPCDAGSDIANTSASAAANDTVPALGPHDWISIAAKTISATAGISQASCGRTARNSVPDTVLAMTAASTRRATRSVVVTTSARLAQTAVAIAACAASAPAARAIEHCTSASPSVTVMPLTTQAGRGG